MSTSFLNVVRNDPCSYCGAPADELDHIEPRARGGEDGWENLAAVCDRCNQSKGARSLLTFLLNRNRPLTPGQQIRRAFGENVRVRRQALGLTQAELARSTGFDLMAISRWERGASSPRGESAVALARALGVSLADLYRIESVAA